MIHGLVSSIAWRTGRAGASFVQHHGATLKILIAESSVDVAWMCQELVRRHGHAATVAMSLDEALIARREGLFDVYLIDLDFNGCGGPALLGSLRRAEGRKAPARAIGWTAFPSMWRISPSARLFDVFLAKPFSLRTLLAALENDVCPECFVALSEQYSHDQCQGPARNLRRPLD